MASRRFPIQLLQDPDGSVAAQAAVADQWLEATSSLVRASASTAIPRGKGAWGR